MFENDGTELEDWDFDVLQSIAEQKLVIQVLASGQVWTACNSIILVKWFFKCYIIFKILVIFYFLYFLFCSVSDIAIVIHQELYLMVMHLMKVVKSTQNCWAVSHPNENENLVMLQ